MSLPPNPENGSSTPQVMRPILKKDLAKLQESSGPPAVQAENNKPEVYRPILKKKSEEEEKIIRTDSPTEEPQEETTEKIVQNAPPWMASGILHMALLLILALCILPGLLNHTPELELVVELDEDIYAEDIGNQTEIEVNSEEDIDEAQETDMAFEDIPVPDPFLAPIELPKLNDMASSESSSINAPAGKTLLSGRTPGGRAGLCGRYGGTKSTEEAVNLALQWLKRQQLKNGSWSLVGPYMDGVMNENQEAATAMALLAFQGAGHTHRDGSHKKVVADGWKWLLKQQQKNGNFFHEGVHNHPYYTHGQCSIALCELYAMTKDEKIREPAIRAIDYLIKSQSPEGGWRYEPNADSDVSVTGWCVMALQSAKMAEIEVPQEVFDRISAYLDRVGQLKGTRYPYQRGEEFTRTMTAEAILCRQYLGWKQDDPRMENALDYVLNQPINYDNGRDVYYWYYATQAMHHKEGKWWTQWNEVMREVVPKQQIKSGKEAGSWDPNRPSHDKWAASDAGRLYVTCLSTYMLQVYYRHLPIYAKMFDAQGLPVPAEDKEQPAQEKDGAKADPEGTKTLDVPAVTEEEDENLTP
ncbi:MAG: terpene cyclase/mutase family protein [Planctomycetia bacterium]|nr:terpene cyclase/mutase family protein [Planctomycetia bacterium]